MNAALEMVGDGATRLEELGGLLGWFLDKAAHAATIVEVNVAAGLAHEELVQLMQTLQ